MRYLYVPGTLKLANGLSLQETMEQQRDGAACGVKKPWRKVYASSSSTYRGLSCCRVDLSDDSGSACQKQCCGLRPHVIVSGEELQVGKVAAARVHSYALLRMYVHCLRAAIDLGARNM